MGLIHGQNTTPAQHGQLGRSEMKYRELTKAEIRERAIGLTLICGLGAVLVALPIFF